MRYLRTALAIACLFLAGCETSGGTIGGLLPAPKFLKGEIKNGTYTSDDKTFSVAIPHKEGTGEYRHMQVKEQTNQFGAYVSFGPSAFDQSIYRVEIGRQLVAAGEKLRLEQIAPEVVEGYKAQLKNGYGSELKEQASRQESLNGKKAYYYQFTQLVPAGKLSNMPENLTHEVYVIDFGLGAAIVWVQKPGPRVVTSVEPLVWVQKPEPEPQQLGIGARALAESVVIHRFITR